ncbi:MAG TPA: DUF2147 domain-containing protein [Rhodanobacteraceae bacterium]
MRFATRLMGLVCLSLLALPAIAATTATPVGTWNQVDDSTGKITSVIQITETNHQLYGTVLKVMNMSPEQIARDGNPPICTQCSDQRHNQPIEGMVIMWGLHADGDQWDGGHVLDPTSGKIYKVKLTLVDGGAKLKVRGYMGFSWLGRTQVWQRVKPAAAPASTN